MNESTVSDIYVRPCVDGNSSTGLFFNFSITVSRCKDDNCTAVNTQPGATMVSPIVLSVTGVTGQIAALIYLHRSTRPSVHRTSFYVMLATLIWVDLFGKLITTPLPVMSYVYGHWVGGIPTCKLHGYCMSLVGMVTHFLVAVMAIERYLGIRCGYFYNRNVTKSKTRRLLIGVFLFVFIFCAMPLLGIGEFKLHYPGTWCHINQHVCFDHPWQTRTFANLYTCLNLICLFTVVFCNIIVVGTLIKMKVTKFKPSKSCRRMAPKKPKEREIQMVILLVIITITFIISWAPHDLLIINNQIWPPSPNQNPRLDIKVIRLVSINQIVDPWSYIICRLVFRSSLWKSCRGVLIGTMSSRRFGSQSGRRNDSGFSVTSGSRSNFKSRKMSKIPLVNSPSEGKMFPDNRADASLDDSVGTTLKHKDKCNLQNRSIGPKSPQKSSFFGFSLRKLFNRESLFRSSKDEFTPQVCAVIGGDSVNQELGLPSCTNQDFCYGRKQMTVSESSVPLIVQEQSCSNIVALDSIEEKDNLQFPLLRGIKTCSQRITRSNSPLSLDEQTKMRRKSF